MNAKDGGMDKSRCPRCNGATWVPDPRHPEAPDIFVVPCPDCSSRKEKEWLDRLGVVFADNPS